MSILIGATDMSKYLQWCTFTFRLLYCSRWHYVIAQSTTCLLFPQDVRRKVARLVAAKCTLAARVDSFHESPEGEVGQGNNGIMHCVKII